MKRGGGWISKKSTEMSHLPVQYISSKINSVIVIENTQENKDHVDKMLFAIFGVGKVIIGSPMTASEAIRYNEGFEAAIKITQNVKVIEVPDIEVDGELVIKGPKRIREERE